MSHFNFRINSEIKDIERALVGVDWYGDWVWGLGVVFMFGLVDLVLVCCSVVAFARCAV